MTTFIRSLRNSLGSALQKVGLLKSEGNISAPVQPLEKANVFAAILSPLETYVVKLQSLLIWERPVASAISFVLLNIIYWLVVSWNRRFYSMLSWVLIVILLIHRFVTRVWPEIKVSQPDGDLEGWTPVHPYVLSVPELVQHLSDLWKRAKIWWKMVWDLREANHGLFCIIMCTLLSLIALFGHLIPGVLVGYLIVVILSLGPGVVLHLIPPSFYDQISGFINGHEETNIQARSVAIRSGIDTDSDLDEFIPETSPELMRQLSLRQSFDSLGNPDNAESLNVLESDSLIVIKELGLESFDNEVAEELELYQGLGNFPSLEEENENDINDALEKTIEEPMDDDENGINFIPTHFKEESSESDNEAQFTEGLSFSKVVKLSDTESLFPTEEGLGTRETKSDRNDDPQKSSNAPSSSDLEDDLEDFEILDESDIVS